MHTKAQHEVLRSKPLQHLGRQSWLRILLAGCFVVGLCTPQAGPQAQAAWTWIGGSNAIDQPGNYGTLGKPSSDNLPPGRWNAAAWTDRDGNLWLFGGSSFEAATGGIGNLVNDLWKFSPATKQWTWMAGNKVAETGSRGVYGTRGSPGKDNWPGARTRALSWTDLEGSFWLFGGAGYDAMGHSGDLNDLWEYDPSKHEWTWVSGSVTVGPKSGRPGVYGTLGVFARGNAPGGREQAVGWRDREGNLWLLGGIGYDAEANVGALNDLWEYQPALNEWVWIGGSTNVPKSVGWPGVYGSLGAHSPTFGPGSRSESAAWTDENGNLWLFGGGGYDKNGSPANLNDLWEFSHSLKAWIWQGGSDISLGCSKNNSPILDCKGQPGVYGVLGEPAHGNTPGGRAGAAAWRDRNGNLWLLGGQGFDSAGNRGSLNDLWELNSDTHEWTWLGGNSTESGCGPIPAGVTFCNGQPGVYGTLGARSPSNKPGARTGAAAWVDHQGNLWLFGGFGVGQAGSDGVLSDLWEYRQAPTAATQPRTPQSIPPVHSPVKPKPSTQLPPQFPN